MRALQIAMMLDEGERSGVLSQEPAEMMRNVLEFSELTARVNDEGWDTSYSNWLRVSRIDASDAILVFSVGGGDSVRGISVNLVRCIELAREVGATILGIVGRDGGYTAAVGEAVIIPPVNGDTITPQTEGFQAVIWHLLVSHPAVRKNPGKWESAT